ncbi:MAG: OmpA family protein [Clostridia bacterium]|nr:OmpA family protein [Clostridia bacterium]
MKKYLALMLAALMIATVFTGCGKAVDKNNNVVNGEFTEYLVAEKVGTLSIDNFSTDEGGVYYKGENGLWGVVSYNGVYDTGAVFTDVTPRGKYFEVTKVVAANENDIANLNKSYLIDGKGNVIIASHATYDVLQDRYVLCAVGTERTFSKDDAVISFTNQGLSCFGSSYDILYKGNWAVYDTVTKKYVPGATGSHYTLVVENGRYFWFDDENKKRVTMNENGENLPNGAKLFDNGSYNIEGKVGEVYDEDGKLMFNYDLTGYIPTSWSNGYYVATKYVDGASKHVVMDNKGKVISSEFDDYITIYGDVIQCGDKICNLEGKTILEGTYESVYFDKMFEQNWMVRKDDYYTIIDKNGNVFFNGPSDDDHAVWTSDFLASKEVDGDHYYYSYKDKDYTIKGNHFAPWIVKTPNANNLYDLVDTMTGKKLLEGYNGYASISRNSLAYYVYAKYNGGADIYLVVSGSQLSEVTTKKNDLYDELAAAFAKEGINATVNKETGEIALDSSVLFGGDSAELTADGKTFLNKFIKAYTSIVTSSKYSGFISKTLVEGHTAPVSGSTYAGDMKLSEDRANNVKNYCISTATGVDVSKISSTFESVGYSNSKPVTDANGNVDMAASRRVSFRFLVNVDF